MAPVTQGRFGEAFYVESLCYMGFLQGKSSPCVFWHPVWEVAVVVHGDDFTAPGNEDSLNLYEAGLKQCFEVKIRGRLGYGIDDINEMRLLNRIISIDAEGLSYEADPRHAELLARALGVETIISKKADHDAGCQDA